MFINRSRRDLCINANAVRANLLAATSGAEVRKQVCNTEVSDSTASNGLMMLFGVNVELQGVFITEQSMCRDFRSHSLALTTKVLTIINSAHLQRIAERVKQKQHGI